MHKQTVIQSRLKPQIHKTNKIINVPKTINIMVKPSAAKSIDYQQSQQKTVKTNNAVRPQKVIQQSVPKVKQQSTKNQPVRGLQRKQHIPRVKYISKEISSESLAKIQGIHRQSQGRILVIIGNGPSISEAPLEKLKHVNKIDTLSINKPDLRLWPTTYWSFFDLSQYKRNEDLWQGYEGTLFNSTAIRKQKSSSIQFKYLGGTGFSKNMTKGLYIGRSTVFASMQIALWMGFDHIYIFGCDMNPEGLNGKLHFYGVNPDVEPKIRAQRFKKESESYDFAIKAMTKEECKKFTFCTEYNPWEFVNSFNSMSHKKAVDHIRDHAQKL